MKKVQQNSLLNLPSQKMTIDVKLDKEQNKLFMMCLHEVISDEGIKRWIEQLYNHNITISIEVHAEEKQEDVA